MSHGFARQGLTAPPLSGGGAWSRPDDWLALTTPDISEQKIVALHAVLPGSNFVAFTITAAFTVDWGDGTAPENFASGATAYRNLAWADYGSDTLTSRGFRQAVITITPQSGQNITSWNFYVKHNQAGLANGYSTGWLDVRLSTPNVTAVMWGASGSTVVHRWLEQFVWVGANSITTFSYMFSSCGSLQSVSLDTSSGTNFSYMFYACASLQSVSLDASSGTTFSNMFSSCGSLQSVVLTGCKYTVSVASAVLGAAALDALYTSLGTAAGAQTITVTGNHGTTGDDPTIATAKGWTVTGS